MFGAKITSDTASSGVVLGQDRRPRLTWRILLAWLGFLGCLLLIGTIVQAATGWLPPVISHSAAGVGITASVLGLVFSPFFTTAHFNGHPSVLLRASRIGELTRQELVELIQDAWLAQASPTRRKAWLKDQNIR